MNWFQNNRWLGTFLVIFGVAILVSLIFLWQTHREFADANAILTESLNEENRLERLTPFPSEANYQKMTVHLDNYRAMLEQMKGGLQRRMLAAPSMAPNEFQARLREVIVVAAQRARAGKVQFPDKFYLGFDQYVARLPENSAAPLLGQELSQIALLMDYLIAARVDSLTSLSRVPLIEESGAAPPAEDKSQNIDRNIVDLTFAASPAAARKVLNQIASSSQQFYIIRTLYVRNEKEKGPPREEGPRAQTPAPNAGLHFIVGDEHVEVSARIEMLRFEF